MVLALKVFEVIKNVANNMSIKVLTSEKRSDCDYAGLNAIVTDILKNLRVTALSESKRDTYTMDAIVSGM